MNVRNLVRMRKLPGPVPWPLFGNLYTVGPKHKKLLFNAYSEWRHKYGKIYKWFAGMDCFVVVSGASAIGASAGPQSGSTAGRELESGSLARSTAVRRVPACSHPALPRVYRQYAQCSNPSTARPHELTPTPRGPAPYTPPPAARRRAVPPTADQELCQLSAPRGGLPPGARHQPQDPPVRAALHPVSALPCTCAGFLILRLQQPAARNPRPAPNGCQAKLSPCSPFEVLLRLVPAPFPQGRQLERAQVHPAAAGVALAQVGRLPKAGKGS